MLFLLSEYAISITGQMHNYKQYEPYGETMLDLFGLTRQSFIGKEKVKENNLGDHGVRKYDYETGRFNFTIFVRGKYLISYLSWRI